MWINALGANGHGEIVFVFVACDLLFCHDPSAVDCAGAQFNQMKSDLCITPSLYVAGLGTWEVIMRKLVLLSSEEMRVIFIYLMIG